LHYFPADMATPKSYKIRFIEPGIISYNDQGAGVVFVSKDALDRMASSFRNCPVIFVPEHHNDSSPDTAFNFDDLSANPAAGIVVGVPYWGDDGWQWVDVSIWDEKAQEAIDALKYNASCAYLVDDTGPAGEWHQLPYDEEMIAGHYMHMAIVPRPRYEGSKILANSKGGHSVAKFKLFQKVKANAAPEPPKPAVGAPPIPSNPAEPKEAMKMNEVDPSSVVMLPSGGQATLAELIEAFKASGAEEEPLDMDDMVDVDGVQHSIGELVAAYESNKPAASVDGQSAQNADPPIDTQAESVVDPSKQGPGVRTNAAGARMVNSALKRAAALPGDDLGNAQDHPDTRTERLARGAARYSRQVAVEAKK
jgi:hypothetical protein